MGVQSRKLGEKLLKRQERLSAKYDEKFYKATTPSDHIKLARWFRDESVKIQNTYVEDLIVVLSNPLDD